MESGEEECAIWLSELGTEPTLTLSCKHVFHDKCATRWLRYHHCTCPLCRRAVSDPSARIMIMPTATTRRHNYRSRWRMRRRLMLRRR
uniref:RING-type domain-containing protein n=1 Tax=Kalanchoe fedtschenkoi TaxID=63787 RepID=A0A7N0UA54_KALFE